nr:PREDICTED: Kv channel-interacting protein 1-like isoform X1 [Bemisia tabaci]
MNVVVKGLSDSSDDLDVPIRKSRAGGSRNCFIRFLKRAWERMSGSTSSEEAEYPEFVDLQIEVEEIATTQPRYRPNSLKGLCQGTRFTEAELKHIYRNLKGECPSGVINEEAFKNIYSKFFPNGATMSNLYAHHVFNSFDLNKTGYLNFEILIHGLSTLLRGTTDEKLRWIFSLYDVKKDGYLTRDEVSSIVGSVFELSGFRIVEPTPEVQAAISDRTDFIFQKLDLDKDGIVTLDEFLRSCKNDDTIRKSLYSFHTVF